MRSKTRVSRWKAIILAMSTAGVLAGTVAVSADGSEAGVTADGSAEGCPSASCGSNHNEVLI
jgi:hypothetical protein